MSVYFVDLTISGAGGIGISTDPYGVDNFLGVSLSYGDTYNVRGTPSKPISSNFNPNGATIQAWDLALYGPWQIVCTTLLSWPGLIQGGIVFVGSVLIGGGSPNSTITFNLNTSIFQIGGSSASIQLTGTETLIISLVGSYLILPGMELYYTGSGTANFQLNSLDSIYISSGPIFPNSSPDNYSFSGTFLNSVSNLTAGGIFTYGTITHGIDSQFSWYPVTLPSFLDSEKTDWLDSKLAVGITTPPNPGNTPYTGYTTGLWGETRRGIGAFYFYYNTPSLSYFSNSSVIDGFTVTSNVNLIAIVNKIQEMGTNTYFNSIAKISKVKVYYTHTAGRENKKLVHISPNLTKQVSWSSFVQDGTWQKTAIKVYDMDGAQIVIPRSVIGVNEDLTHTNHIMTLNNS